MLVFIAHNGKTVELEVQPGTRVELVQRALAGRTDIPAEQQLLIINGSVLDPTKQLAAYSLPGDSRNRPGDVFLYSKSHLQHGLAVAPMDESLQSFSLHVASPPHLTYEPHELDAVASPLVRALPQYERQFRHDLAHTRAVVENCQARHRACMQLVGEIEVQGRAIDAARSNVEKHYTFIHEHYSKFMQRYMAQHAKHKDMLARFPRALATLASVPIHPSARTEKLRSLIDLVPQQALRDWAASCDNAMQSLAAKVADGAAVWESLKADVEALLLQAPTVALDALAHELAHLHAATKDQGSVLQVLQADYASIERLLASAMRGLADQTASGSGGTISDKCELMEAMHENHMNIMPRVDACEAALAAFCQRCIDDKNQMTRDVVGQLQRIAGQQSKIRALRNRLAAHDAALAKEQAEFAELVLVTRVPAAYRQCLAECMRREAFWELYTNRGTDLAEKMGKLRSKEAVRREAFAKGVAGLMPQELLTSLGLEEPQPPHCQIHLPLPSVRLPHISLEDVRRIPLHTAEPGAGAVSQGGAAAASAPTATGSASTGTLDQDDGTDSVEGAVEEPQQAHMLELENARLRAELAACLALEATRAAEARTSSSLPSTPKAMAQEASTAAIKFREALAAKEDLVRRQQADLAASRQVTASYEGRIRTLESRLALAASQAHAVGSASPSGAGIAAGSGFRPSDTATGEEADVRQQVSSTGAAGTGSLPAPASAGPASPGAAGLATDVVESATLPLTRSAQASSQQGMPAGSQTLQDARQSPVMPAADSAGGSAEQRQEAAADLQAVDPSPTLDEHSA